MTSDITLTRFDGPWSKRPTKEILISDPAPQSQVHRVLVRFKSERQP